MNNTISIKMRNFECNFILEEMENGDIKVQVPYIDQDENCEDYVEHHEVEIEKGKKEQVVRQFFEEDNTTIIRGGVAYNIETILFDECELPKNIEPDIFDN